MSDPPIVSDVHPSVKGSNQMIVAKCFHYEYRIPVMQKPEHGFVGGVREKRKKTRAERFFSYAERNTWVGLVFMTLVTLAIFAAFWFIPEKPLF